MYELMKLDGKFNLEISIKNIEEQCLVSDNK